MAGKSRGGSGDDQVKKAKDAIETVGDIFSPDAGGSAPPPPAPPNKPAGSKPIPPPDYRVGYEDPPDEGDPEELADLAKRRRMTVEEYQAGRKAYDDEQNARVQRELEESERRDAQRKAEEEAEQQRLVANEKDNLWVGAPSALAPQPGQPEMSEQETDEAKEWSGCSPKVLAVVLVVLALVIAGVLVAKNRDDGSSKTTTAAADESCSQTGARGDHVDLIACDKPSGMNGHWVLATGLTNPQKDMPVQCDTQCQHAPGITLTVDTPEATIDISGDKIIGGTYRTGYTTTVAGNKCPGEIDRVSKLDATASGGVDENLMYGTLILDGHATDIVSCDSNYQPMSRVSPNENHTSRFIYLDGDTLYLCYNLDPTTYHSCTDPAGGSGATFERG